MKCTTFSADQCCCCTSCFKSEGTKILNAPRTYPSAFFLPLVFENSSESSIGYSTVTFGFDPCAVLRRYRKRTKTILFHACSDIKK